METENKMVVAWGWVKRKWGSSCLMGIVSVLQHEKVLEIEFMRINTLNTTELYIHLQVVKRVIFILYVFYP